MRPDHIDGREWRGFSLKDDCKTKECKTKERHFQQQLTGEKFEV